MGRHRLWEHLHEEAREEALDTFECRVPELLLTLVTYLWVHWLYQ